MGTRYGASFRMGRSSPPPVPDITRFRSTAYQTGRGKSSSAGWEAAGEVLDDLPPHLGRQLVHGAVAGRLARPSRREVPRRRVEIADVDREHGDVPVAGEVRRPLPQSVLVDGRQGPLRRGVVDVPADQLELGVEVVLDAGERLEPVPGHPPHLVDCVGLPPGRRPRRAGCSGSSGGGTDVANPSSSPPRRLCPPRAARS